MEAATGKNGAQNHFQVRGFGGLQNVDIAFFNKFIHFSNFFFRNLSFLVGKLVKAPSVVYATQQKRPMNSTLFSLLPSTTGAVVVVVGLPEVVVVGEEAVGFFGL